jgi:hypothetical protein
MGKRAAIPSGFLGKVQGRSGASGRYDRQANLGDFPRGTKVTDLLRSPDQARFLGKDLDPEDGMRRIEGSNDDQI